MEENIEVDVDGLESQRREEILKSGKYARVEIVVGKEEYKEPVVQVTAKGVNSVVMGSVLASLKAVVESIIKRDKLAGILAEEMYKNMVSTEHDVKNKEE